MLKYFSLESKELIGYAREYARLLGASKISSLHFLVADCFVESEYSIKDFMFTNEEHFQNFLISLQIEKTKHVDNRDINDLTEEASRAIRLSLKEKQKYNSELAQPYHIFLASCKSRVSLLVSISEREEGFYDRLVTYYQTKGLKLETTKEDNLLSKFKNRFTKLRGL